MKFGIQPWHLIKATVIETYGNKGDFVFNKTFGENTSLTRFTSFRKVNGGWSKWTLWGACTETCGVGKQYRFRKCDNPPPECSGSNCSSARQEYRKCSRLCDISTQMLVSLTTNQSENLTPSGKRLTTEDIRGEIASEIAKEHLILGVGLSVGVVCALILVLLLVFAFRKRKLPDNRLLIKKDTRSDLSFENGVAMDNVHPENFKFQENNITENEGSSLEETSNPTCDLTPQIFSVESIDFCAKNYSNMEPVAKLSSTSETLLHTPNEKNDLEACQMATSL